MSKTAMIQKLSINFINSMPKEHIISMPKIQKNQLKNLKDIKIIIPDIHGCYKELVEIVEIAKSIYPVHKRIYLGGYVSRGPDSVPVLEYVRKDVARGNIALIGNHDFTFLDYLAGGGDYYLAPAFGGKDTIMSIKKASHYSVGSSKSDIVNFMNKTGLRRFIETLPYFHIEGNWIFTHSAAGKDKYKGLIPDFDCALWTSITKGNWKEQMNPPDGYYLICGHSMVRSNREGKREPLIFPGKGIYLDTGMGKDKNAQFYLAVIENNIFIGFITKSGFVGAKTHF